MPGGEAQRRRRDAEGDHVGERVELATERGMLCRLRATRPSRTSNTNAAGASAAAAKKYAIDWPAANAIAQKTAATPQAALRERQEIREVELADHREVPHWHSVPGARNTWRVIIFVCATPSTT